MPKTYRAAVIGSTGKGGYGHGLDTAFLNVEGVQLVAVADDDEAGLSEAGKRLGVTRLYTDYQQMLAREKPDLVTIGPRWVTSRVPMVEAAAAAGCHIYCEKPLAGDLVAADSIINACRQHKRTLAVAHQFRAMPPVREALVRLEAGKYGKLLRMQARPKDDHRGGGEELIVHGTHLMDMMIAFAGAPRWVSGHVAVGKRDAKRDDAHEATEPLGPVAGDSIAAVFGFDDGVRGFFDSTADQHRPGSSLYGLFLECERAALYIRSPGDVFVYPAPLVQPERTEPGWEKIWVESWHFTPEHKPRSMKDWIHRGNKIMVADFLAAIEQGRPPLASGEDARSALEMIQGVYASHLADGRRLQIPLTKRQHPLAPKTSLP